jgi:[ribosomal protein S18]-alanine N-acetyltransferase
MAFVQFTIRSFQPEDFRILWEIDQSCFPPGISYTQFELKSYIFRSNAFTLVAEQDLSKPGANRTDPEGQSALGGSPNIVGFLVGERTPRGRGHIITIDVRAQARRHSVGSKLLNSAEQQFRSWRCGEIRLETAVDNVSALSFYKRHGYNVIRTVPRYYSNGLDALLLEKDLHSRLSSG